MGPTFGAKELTYINARRRVSSMKTDDMEARRIMSTPVPAEAEVTFDRSGERSIEKFGETAHYDAHLDEAGVSIGLLRNGDERAGTSIELHFEFALFADILRDLAKTVSSVPAAAAAHRDALREGAAALCQALDARQSDRDDLSHMKAEDEVLLLHVLE